MKTVKDYENRMNKVAKELEITKVELQKAEEKKNELRKPYWDLEEQIKQVAIKENRYEYDPERSPFGYEKVHYTEEEEKMLEQVKKENEKELGQQYDLCVELGHKEYALEKELKVAKKEYKDIVNGITPEQRKAINGEKRNLKLAKDLEEQIAELQKQLADAKAKAKWWAEQK